MTDVSYCDVTERRFTEFERGHPVPVIAAVVRQCRAAASRLDRCSRSGPSSSTAESQDREHGAQDDFAVQPQAPVLDVVVVIGSALAH